MLNQYIDPGLLAKQVAGVALTGPEARIMASGLQQCIKVKAANGHHEVVVLMLRMVGTRYFEDVWDILLLGSDCKTGAAS